MSADTATTANPSDPTGQLDALFAPWARTDAPGLVVGVSICGEPVYRRGFGMASLESRWANGPSTRMRLGSTSKHFTALLALLLAEEGRFDLDAPIRAYLPELTGPAGDPSARLLLQHRGGLRCHLDLALIAHGYVYPPIGTALKTQLRQTERNFAPGEAMIYNNGGYHLVSIALERVACAPFESLTRERLFAPLGMRDTESVSSDFDIVPGIATMHLPRRGGWRRGLFLSHELKGEGSGVSTVDDMLRWMAHLRTRDRFGSARTWAQLLERPVYDGGEIGGYALGLMIGRYRGLEIIHHAGSVAGGTCQMLTLPNDGVDVIVIANGAPGADPVQLAERVVDIVLADRLGPPAQKVSAADHPSLLGDWWSPRTRMVYSLIDQGGALALTQATEQAGQLLTPSGDGGFVKPARDIGEIRLTPTPQGGLDIRFGGRSEPYQRLMASPADKAAFARAATGRYVSVDAGATAEIADDRDGLSICVFDALGETRAPLIALSANVGASRPASPMVPSRFAITLDQGGGAAPRFHLSTSRTRNLEFHRV